MQWTNKIGTVHIRRKRRESLSASVTTMHAPILSFCLFASNTPSFPSCHNIQQIILVGAGLTSVELRRGYTAAVTTNDPALGMTSSHHNQPSVRSPNPSVDGSCPQQSGVLPSSRRPRIVPPVRDLFLNWRRFLAGTELSTSMQEPSVKNL